jgi:zinc transport system permease protein
MTAEALLLAIATAVAAGLVGSFAVMRRMTLAADALSHVALPGIGVALALHIHPLFGAVAMLFFGALLVWGLQSRTRLATETIIGVVFSAALAIGSMTTSGEDLIEALFGSSGPLSWLEVLFGSVSAIAVIVVLLAQRNRLIITLVSPEIARTVGIDVRRVDLLYLQMFALTVALGLRYLGVLLMGSLIIIPATTARYVARSLGSMLVVAVVLSVASTLLGTLGAPPLHVATGPLIIAITAGFFLLGLLWRWRS